MQITTQQVIKSLPFEEGFKKELLEKYPTLPEGVKYDVTELLWDLYYSMYEMKYEANTEKAFLKAESNEEKLDKDFYNRIREKTEKEVEQDVVSSSSSADLTSTRAKIEDLIRDAS